MSWGPAPALGLAANGPRVSLPPCHGFYYLEVFPAIQPCSVYSTLLFLAEISPPALPWHTLCRGTRAAPHGGAGRWVSLCEDGQSWWLPEDLQDTQGRDGMTPPPPLPQAPIGHPRRNSMTEGTTSYKSNSASDTPGVLKGLQQVSSQLFRLGLVQKPWLLRGILHPLT